MSEEDNTEDADHCEHDICPDEFICLYCGEDMREDIASRAYDRYKDYLKYGE